MEKYLFVDFDLGLSASAFSKFKDPKISQWNINLCETYVLQYVQLG